MKRNGLVKWGMGVLLLCMMSACGREPRPAVNPQNETEMEKRRIGNQVALYPMPVTVVGAQVEGRTNWLTVAHVGIIGHDRLLVSMSRSHYTNRGIRAQGRLSVNLVSREMLPTADYVGRVSGAEVDKSHAFEYHWGADGSPVIDGSPLAMECRVEDIYETPGFDNFVCSVVNTYADPAVLDSAGRLDYTRLKPVLFEFPTYSYLATGEVLGRCQRLDREPGMCAKEPMAADGFVRLSKIEVYPEYREAYLTRAVEVGETSLRTEPGVLTMYALAEKENPCRITILETYASRAAYDRHIASEHFRRYKQETLHMVKSLVLADQVPLNADNQIRNFMR